MMPELALRPDQTKKKTGFPAVVRSTKRWIERTVLRREVLDEELVIAVINKVHTDAMEYGFQTTREWESVVHFDVDKDPLPTDRHVNQVCNTVVYNHEGLPLQASVIGAQIVNKKDESSPKDPRLWRAATLTLTHSVMGVPYDKEKAANRPHVSGSVSHNRIKDTDQSKLRVEEDHHFGDYNGVHEPMSVEEIESFLREVLDCPVDVEATRQDYAYFERERDTQHSTTKVSWNSGNRSEVRRLPITSEA